MGRKATLHKYYRAHLSLGDVWACALPECSHYLPKHIEQLINGRATICWNCNNRTTMSPANMGMDRPFCPDCLNAEMAELPLSDAMKEFIVGKK